MSAHGVHAPLADQIILLKLLAMSALGNVDNNVEQDEEGYLHEMPGLSWIGTDGLAVCVALIVAGQDASGGWKAGIHHFSGISDPADIFREMETYLRGTGMTTVCRMYAIGGSAPGPDDAGGPLRAVKALIGKAGFERLKVLENPRSYSEQGDNSAACVKICVAGTDLMIQYSWDA